MTAIRDDWAKVRKPGESSSGSSFGHFI
jgi:hypothetical protein